MDKAEMIALRLWWGALLILLLGLLALSWPYAISAYYLEQGSQFLDRGEVEQAIDDFTAALTFEPANTITYRQLAQTYLQSNQPAKALAAAQQALALAPDNPLAQLELGDIYDRLGDNEQAIAHYEAGLVEDRQPQLVANYLQLAERLWASDDRAGAVAIWQDKMRGYSHGNLYANWRLARYFADDQEAATPYQDGVRYFSLTSIAVLPDRRLDQYQAQAFAGAVADGLWTRETLLNVVSYRVWQNQSQATENVLQAILAKQPTDADLHFYLGEMYQRRGDLAQAEAVFRRVLEIDSKYAPAYLRLGMVAEAKCGRQTAGCASLPEAARWYEQYHTLALTDVLGLRKLTEADEALGKPEALALRAELEAQTDDRRLVAEALKLGRDEFELGENLIKEMNFENGLLVRDENWQWDAWQGPTNNDALFFAGQDELEEKNTARTQTLWLRPVAEGGGLPYADYGQSIQFQPNTFYALSFYYKTNDFQEGSAFVGLLEFVLQPRFVFTHTNLPETGSMWKKGIFVGKSYQEAIELRLLLRNWGRGNVEFNQVELRQVKLRQR